MDNNDDIYYFYKKVFNNIYLKNLIFKYVKDINIEIIISNSKTRYPVENKRRKYHDITFEWIVKNKHYPILFDWYRDYNNEGIIRNYIIQENQCQYIIQFLKDMNQIIKSNDMGESLSSNSNIDLFKKLYSNQPTTEFIKDFLFKFYTLNKSKLINFKRFAIPLNNFDKLLMGMGRTWSTLEGEEYLDLLEVSVYSSNFEFLKIVYNDHFVNLKKIDLIVDNLLDWALKNGDIESFKYLYHTADIKEYNKTGFGLEYACNSDNYEEVIQFLVNDLKFSSISSFHNLTKEASFKILQIDHQLYCKISHSIKVTLDENISLESLPFKNFLNFIQNLYCAKPNDFSNHLNFILNYQKQNKMVEAECYSFNPQPNGFFDGMISMFTQAIGGNGNTGGHIQEVLDTRFDILNFNEFNTEREVKRLYIHYILLKLKNPSSLSNELKFVFKFISDYKEYQLMIQLLNPFDCFLSKSSFCSNKSKDDFEKIKHLYLLTATNYTDLFIFIYNNFRNQFVWNDISYFVVKNNNLNLLKFFFENSIPVASNIIDSSSPSIEILKYLLSKQFTFTESSIYNCLKFLKIESFILFLSFIPSNSTNITMESVCKTIDSYYYKLICNDLSFKKEIKHLIDIGKIDSNLLLTIKPNLINSLQLPSFLIKEKD